MAGYDCYRTYPALSPVYDVATEGNRAPVIIAGYDGVQDVWSNETLQLTCQISDPDGDDFRVDFESGSEAATCRSKLSGECVISITGHSAEPGLYEAKITVADEYGAVSSVVLEYHINK